MKKYIFRIFAVLSLFIAVSPALRAENDMKKLLSSPDPKMDLIFLGQELNTRLDMIDFFEAGMDNFSYDNQLFSKIRLGALDDRHLRFENETEITVDMYLLTTSKDSLMVSVMAMPARTDNHAVFVDDIRLGRNIGILEPQYTDWLTDAALKGDSLSAIQGAVPYVTAVATVDIDNCVVTLTNTAIDVPGLDPEIVAAFRPTLTYTLKNGKFRIKQ